MGQFCPGTETDPEKPRRKEDIFVPPIKVDTPPIEPEPPIPPKPPTPPPVLEWEPFNKYDFPAATDDNPKSELPTADTIEAEKLGPPGEPNIHKMVLPPVDWKFYRIYQMQTMAYAAIKEVREGRGQTITNDDFKLITQFSS